MLGVEGRYRAKINAGKEMGALSSLRGSAVPSGTHLPLVSNCGYLRMEYFSLFTDIYFCQPVIYFFRTLILMKLFGPIYFDLRTL